MKGSAHYEGRAIDVFVRPVNDANHRRGWAIASYLVAQARALEIDARDLRRPDLDGRAASEEGGATTTRRATATTATERAVLEHRDHVHVDVVEGD